MKLSVPLSEEVYPTNRGYQKLKTATLLLIGDQEVIDEHLEFDAEVTIKAEVMNAPELYEIRVAGHLSKSWAARFEGMSIRHEPEGETVLSGSLDQAALHGVMMKIRDLGVKLISVKRIGATGLS